MGGVLLEWCLFVVKSVDLFCLFVLVLVYLFLNVEDKLCLII